MRHRPTFPLLALLTLFFARREVKVASCRVARIKPKELPPAPAAP